MPTTTRGPRRSALPTPTTTRTARSPRTGRSRLVAIGLGLVAAVATVPATLTTPVVSPAVGASAASSAGASMTSTAPRRRARLTAHRRAVLDSQPVAHLRSVRDLVTGTQIGRPTGSPDWAKMPNGVPARVFDGRGEHLTFPSRGAYSIATTGQLTVEYWVRPDTLQFADEEGSGYVYMLGKGDAGRHEWYARMYSLRNSENRPNRMSGYAFNSSGGLGAGSYVQDTVRPGQWMQFALVFDTRPQPGMSLGSVRIYKDGVLRDTDSLADYGIRPSNRGAPFRIGTGYLGSYFQGAVGDVVFYDRALAGSRIAAHHQAMYAR